jgi:dolichyl-phosphate beta-glucosyltransferase
MRLLVMVYPFLFFNIVPLISELTLTRRTFCNLHVERWAFDVELLFIAQRLNIPILEVPVSWQEMEGSKLVPFWSWLEMGRDLILISLRHMMGAWKIVPEPKFA